MSSASDVRLRRSSRGTPLTFSPYSTFWATVMWGNSAYSWKTVLTSRRRAGRRGDVDAAEPDRPRGRLLEPGDHAQHRGLARARRAEDGEQLAVVDGQVGALDGDDLVAGCRRIPCGRRPARSADRQRRRRSQRAAAAPTVPEGIGRSYEFRGLTAAPSAISARLTDAERAFPRRNRHSRHRREERRMSATSSSGVSIAAKWPPVSKSVQCGRWTALLGVPADRHVLGEDGHPGRHRRSCPPASCECMLCSTGWPRIPRCRSASRSSRRSGCDPVDRLLRQLVPGLVHSLNFSTIHASCPTGESVSAKDSGLRTGRLESGSTRCRHRGRPAAGPVGPCPLRER